jgi:2-polyprenyl-3-methyl-5-hydroxy-6-metoxy-1,4-benzoquinol methylase
MNLYNEEFYKTQQVGSKRSAKVIIPLVVELVHPKSVLDVGCGMGTWLSVFKEHGVDDIWGVDGNWIDKNMLQIPKERFKPIDLKGSFNLDREFDLVVSVEVAEHLPSKSVDNYIDSLTKHAPIVLFSAAIPSQGGTDHINEQWPDYWVKHFQKRNYIVCDPIRKKIWQNENVEFWYAQNILVFVKKNLLKNYPELQKEVDNTRTNQLSMVHPKQHLLTVSRANPRNMTFKETIFALPAIMRNSLRRRSKS